MATGAAQAANPASSAAPVPMPTAPPTVSPPSARPRDLLEIAATAFFLDEATRLGLTEEQRNRLVALKEKSMIAYVRAQRWIDQAEQDLWVLTSAPTRDAAKTETQVKTNAHLAADQTMAFEHALNEAIAILTDAQRQAAVVPVNVVQSAPKGRM